MKETIPAAKRNAAMILTTVIVASLLKSITPPIPIADSARKMLLNLLLYPNVIIFVEFIPLIFSNMANIQKPPYKSPRRERMFGKIRIIITPVPSDFFPEPFRPLIWFILRNQFQLSHHKSLILTMKLIYFESMSGEIHKITSLVDNPRLAQKEQQLRVLSRNLLLPLEPA